MRNLHLNPGLQSAGYAATHISRPIALRRCVGSTDAKEAWFYLSLDKDALIVLGAPQRLHSAVVQVVGKLSQLQRRAGFAITSTEQNSKSP